MLKLKTNKRLFLLTALLLIALFLSPAHAAPSAANNKLSDSNNTLLKDVNFPGSDLGAGELFYKMLLAVFVIIVLAFGALYLSKKVLPKFSQVTGKEIRITESVNLGRQRTLHMLKIADRKILIGVTGESITKLSEIKTDPDPKNVTEES